MWNAIEFAKIWRINFKETPLAKMNRRQLCGRARAAPVWIAVAVLTTTWAWDVQGFPAESQRLESTALGQYVPIAHGFELGEMTGESAPQIVQPSWANGEGVLLAQSNTEELRQALEQEQHKPQALSRDLTIAQRDVEFMMLLLNQTREEWAGIVEAAEAETAKLQKSLQKESDRAARLEQDLAAARRDVETQMALAAKASEEGSRQKQAMENGAAELQKSLQQESGRAARLQQDLAAARRGTETQTALATKAAAEANQLKKTAKASSADLRKSLQQEHERASRLEQDLATARQDVETQTALAAKASDEAAQLRRATESSAAELRQSLEGDRAAQLERDLALARSVTPTPSMIPADQIITQHEAEAAKPVAAKEAAVADARASAQSEDATEVTRLVAYARVLLGRGDIGSARIVLQRATEMGSAQASFTLAETYDPVILSKWGTYGTRGDAKRALDLYAQALAGGIKEAKERADALHR